jgi:DNA-binding response OmpR family regulator
MDTPATGLIVTEDEELARVAGTALVERGYRVTLARDGASALVRLAAMTPSARLIVLDAGSSEERCLETLRALQSREETRQIPVILVTELRQPLHPAAGLGLETVWYYTKPITDPHDFGLLVEAVAGGGETEV